jgi:ATP-dependent DNA helicase RecG
LITLDLNWLQTPVEYAKGVGPKRADVLKMHANIRSFADLLNYFPFRYVDKSQIIRVCDIFSDQVAVQLKGKISNIKEEGNGRTKRLTAIFSDESGSLELVWFKGIKYLKDTLNPNTTYLLFGKPTAFKGRFNFAHPELEDQNKATIGAEKALQPVYPSGEKLAKFNLNSKGIEKIIEPLLPELPKRISEFFPQNLIDKLKLLPLAESYKQIHAPDNAQLLEKATFRFKFEEFFLLQLFLLQRKIISAQKSRGHTFSSVGENFLTFYNNHLPFQLTNAQKRVIKEIRRDTGSGSQMNRLLQGDVGSGKTIVALLSMLLAIDNGFQACIMAPTEILANQHYESIKNLLEPMKIPVALLTGSTKTAERKIIKTGLDTGQLKILIGTHALLEDWVSFNNLGLAVVDEQHRFGVKQRAIMWKKNKPAPHILVMTATPIPRTLAMTVYGDLEVSVIDELPPGRKPIKTLHKYDSARLQVFGFMEEQIKLGRQIYVVYPLIEESEKLDLKDLQDGFEAISRRFPKPNYQVSIVHGKMKAQDKDFEMQRFLKGETQIMVATTVIEVGVNVPNASVMVIENAERFGLSQLHQLRGRVGRGADQSYCILMSSFKLSHDGRKRLETMCETNDGFKIAEVDLKLRGPGDIMGTQQSGVLDFKIADIVQDQHILKLARNEATDLLDKDPYLSKPENFNLKQKLSETLKEKVSWSRIS